MISSLCIICVITLPVAKELPKIIENFEIMELDKNSVNQETDFITYKENITDKIRSLVSDLLYNEFGVNCEVSISMDYKDMSAIRLSSIQVYIEKTDNKTEIKQFLERLFWCEVSIIES